MSSKKKFFENFSLYAVTNFHAVTPETLSLIDRAYRGGAGIVQLRLTDVSDQEFLRLGFKVREISRHYGRGLVINNRLDIALALEADAVHVGQNDLPLEQIRRVLARQDSSLLIGKSTHSLDQALQAESEGADYLGVGPVFATPTKPDYPPVGLDLIRAVKRKVRVPFAAIGGIQEENLAAVLEAGAACVAVVRAIFEAPDPEEAARRLKTRYEEARSQHV